MQTRRLGKLAPKPDDRTLQLANYFFGSQPPPSPPSINWGTKVSAWGELLNNELECCTVSAMGHAVMAWTSSASTEFVVPDSAIIPVYSAISGYNPKTGQNDDGATCIDALNEWRKIGIAGHKITAYVAITPGHQQHTQAAIDIFGGVYAGIQLPISAQMQSVWDVPVEGLHGDGAPGSWGGHCVPIIAYDPTGLIVVTWGSTLKMTWPFFKMYCDEGYAVLSTDFMNARALSASGFNMPQLKVDLGKVTG